MIGVLVIPDRCACRWTAGSGETGWRLEKAHPGCLADHEKEG